ncbi:hypothetical protein [Campylobacter sp. 19-13652]|uniref:hypothetical protein n=1 Tax=Campylobacter sp. 19-13652 TaxID=2840180 RepID=UPI001C844CBF|nr:hypothetical protein [Campylobacter sp. 19-13652]
MAQRKNLGSSGRSTGLRTTTTFMQLISQSNILRQRPVSLHIETAATPCFHFMHEG